jgi:TonB family protein
VFAQFADSPGVTVNLGGAALIHRPAVVYPDAARLNGVAGTVSVQVTLDPAGNVADAHVISGPEELRRGVLASVLQWHFARSEAGRTRQIDIGFQPPPAPADQGAPRPEPLIVMAPQPAPEPSPATREIAQIRAQMSALLQQNQQGTPGGALVQGTPSQALMDEVNALNARMKSLQRIGGFQTTGISDAAARELIAGLPVHEGDPPSQENINRIVAAVKQYDEHLSASFNGSGDVVTVQIFAPGASTPQTIKVGGNVQAANLVNKVVPVYPPAAKAAGIQGPVVMDVIIGRDGYVREIRVTSGDPALTQAAVDAVKQWIYKPTMLNGSPVEVQTMVTVNFALAQ